MSRLAILSGPSCAGKSPLHRALARLRPDLEKRLKPLVLYNSRPPRPGEKDGVDYHFRSRPVIEALRGKEGYEVLEVRGDLQAIDLEELHRDLEHTDVLFEGNPAFGTLLLSLEALAKVPRTGIFLAPLSRDEIVELKDPDRPVDLPQLVTDIMRRKLLRRMRRQKGELSGPDLENIERRAGSAYEELKTAALFRHVIPNHDGEDSEHWDAFYYPLGDARKALNAVIDLLEGRTPEIAERWEDGLLP
ncbi:hypothetical protein [Kiritimatiella glycovorans]|uniref:Guanylate kinase n=1 Tax=Kiritimatiella glycovorans TaxID=1307763 RepID=A0A0G3EG36_9BACT|nr:hypothetical protein [Kiritimatiella glycovorans]AKJ63795.1 Guanylate kinase [Kiritimatiella glycovorans]